MSIDQSEQLGVPLVSCIMPTRNRPPFVGQSIWYFRRQDYANKELLVRDDGDEVAFASASSALPVGPATGAVGALQLTEDAELCERFTSAALDYCHEHSWYRCGAPLGAPAITGSTSLNRRRTQCQVH